MLSQRRKEYSWGKTVRPKICWRCSSNNRRCERYRTRVKHREWTKRKNWSHDTQRKVNYMTNIDTTDNMQTDGTEIEKVINYEKILDRRLKTTQRFRTTLLIKPALPNAERPTYKLQEQAGEKTPRKAELGQRWQQTLETDQGHEWWGD